MSFRDFINKDRLPPEPPKREEPTMERIPPRKVTRQVTQMSPQRRRQVELRDAQAESEELLEALNEKLRGVLYRFGMAGLEKIDRAIVETCREMINPGYEPRRSKKPVGLTESVMPQRQQQQPRRQPSFIDIAAAAVKDMGPMQDMSDHLPPQVDDTPVVDTPRQAAAPTVAAQIPVSQPDAGADYFDNLDESSLDPDALEAMLNKQNGGGMDAGIAMDPNMLAALGQALKK